MRLFRSIACAGLVAGCAATPAKTSQSEVKQLSAKDFACTNLSAAVVQKSTAEIPQNFFTGFDSSDQTLIYQRMAEIPEVYRTYMYRQFRSGIFGGVVADDSISPAVGLTTLQGFDMLDMKPRYMQIASGVFPDAINFSLIHEMGHAVEGLVSQQAQAKGLDHERERDSLFNEGASNASLRGYARSNPTEYWAEAFNNFYCSPDSQAFIKEQLPKTYQYLTTVLEPAVWPQDGNSQINTGGSTQDDAATEAGSAFIALADGTDDNHAALYASVSQQAAHVYFCTSQAATVCTSAAGTSWELERVRTTGDRLILKASDPFLVKTDASYSVTAYTASGSVLSKASFKIARQ